MHTVDQESVRKRALILCNGDPPGEALLHGCAEEADWIVCCDGAARYAAAASLRCDLLIGDFDSLGGIDQAQAYAERLGAKVERFPAIKDKTDSEIAADAAIAAGCNLITFLGALGGRFDMALANVEMLCLLRRRGVDAVVRDEQNDIHATCTHLFLYGSPGDTVSFLPLGVNCVIRCTDGLAYPLYDYEMSLGESRCVSNVMTEERAYVEIAQGWVLAIQSRDAVDRL